MIDPCPGLGAHQGGGGGVSATAGPIDNPVDQLGRDVFVGAEVQQFLLAQPIYDKLLRAGIGGDKIEHGIDEPLDAAGDFRARLQQDRRLRAAFGNFLVFELLGQGEVVGLVVQSLRLTGVLVGADGAHHPNPTAGDVAEPHVEPVERSSMDEGHAVGQVRAMIVGQELWIEPKRQRVAVLEIDVGSAHSDDRVEELAQYRLRFFEINLVVDLFAQDLKLRLERLVVQRIGWIESLQQEVGAASGVHEVPLGQPGDSIELERVGVGSNQDLMHQMTQGDDDLGAGQVQLGVPIGEVEGAFVEPFEAK